MGVGGLWYYVAMIYDASDALSTDSMTPWLHDSMTLYNDCHPPAHRNHLPASGNRFYSYPSRVCDSNILAASLIRLAVSSRPRSTMQSTTVELGFPPVMAHLR